MSMIRIQEKHSGAAHDVHFENSDDAKKALSAAEKYWENSGFRAVKIIGCGKTLIVSTDAVASVTLVYPILAKPDSEVKTKRLDKRPDKMVSSPILDTRHNVAVALAKKPAAKTRAKRK